MATRMSNTVQLQSAALPYRFADDGSIEVLLLTARKSGCWGLPKGKIPVHMGMAASAAKEAYEEAGVLGEVHGRACGVFRTTKRISLEEKQVVEVVVYPLLVTRQVEDWPERGQRKIAWVPAERAVSALNPDSAIGQIIAHAAHVLARPNEVVDVAPIRAFV